jgi:hypothetical protein
MILEMFWLKNGEEIGVVDSKCSHQDRKMITTQVFKKSRKIVIITLTLGHLNKFEFGMKSYGAELPPVSEA